MEIHKSIAELIIDRAFAEGATLHTTFDFCRLEVFVGKDQNGEFVFARFEPSKGLFEIMKRNRVELRKWLDDHRREFCREHGVAE